MNYLNERINQIIGWVRSQIIVESKRLDNIFYAPCDYKGIGHEAPQDGWKPQTTREDMQESIPAGGSKTRYGEYHAWFKAEVTIPENMKGKHVELCVRSMRMANPQYIVYLDGKT